MTQRRPSHLEAPAQVAQRFPLLPQFESELPATQFPKASQQPEQLVASQERRQVPLTHVSPSPHCWQALPLRPQAPGEIVQTPFGLQQPAQFAGPH